MKSEWRVQSNYCCGDRQYQVCRVRNTDATDHSGNREYGGIYSTKAEAQEAADRLNREDGNEKD